MCRHQGAVGQIGFAQDYRRLPHRFDFRMTCNIIVGPDALNAFGDDFPSLHNDAPDRAVAARLC